MGELNQSTQENKQTKRRWLWAAPVIVLAAGVWWGLHEKPLESAKPEDLYDLAVSDAVDAEPSEMEQLVELTPSSPLTTWDDQGRVLLLSWNKYPESYIEGEEIILSYGSIWTFTDKEISAWYGENKKVVKDWDLRLEQLIGLPPENGYTHVSGFWVDPKDVIRPAYVTDVTAQMQISFPEETEPEYKEWFEENSKFSYEESAYPWTRLGYTYDWAANGTEYGLTEFLVEENAAVEVEFTKTTEEFLAWMDTAEEGS